MVESEGSWQRPRAGWGRNTHVPLATQPLGSAGKHLPPFPAHALLPALSGSLTTHARFVSVLCAVLSKHLARAGRHS